jgi:DNA repair photolyase
MASVSSLQLFPPRPALPVLGQQRDITYYDSHAASVLNDTRMTGMAYWSVNPYTGCAFGCAYCYARYAHRYVMERAVTGSRLPADQAAAISAIPPWLAFERHIVVKRNAPDALARALRHGSERHLSLLRGEMILIGTATDPYQPAERRYRVTRGILEVLAQHPGLSIGIITKSPLITRDTDLLARIARRSQLSVHISLITLDRALARRLEPRAPTPDARLRAIRRLTDAGVTAGINIMPVLPGITDDPAMLDALVHAAADAGAARIGVCALRLQFEARKRYLPFIAEEFPALAARYESTYARDTNAPERYRAGLSRYVKQLGRKYGIRVGERAEDEELDVVLPSPEPDPQFVLPFAG